MNVNQWIFIGCYNIFRPNRQPKCQRFSEALGFLFAIAIIPIWICAPLLILPKRNPVSPPITSESPAGQRFTGIPFALPEVQQSARCKVFPNAMQQFPGNAKFRFTKGRSIPFFAVHIVNRNKCGFAPHRQSNVSGCKFLIDAIP